MKIVGQVSSKAEAKQIESIAKVSLVGQRTKYLSMHYKQLNHLKTLINEDANIDTIIDKAEEILTE